MAQIFSRITIACMGLLLGSATVHAGGHYATYQCGSHFEVQPVGGDGSYGGTIYGHVPVPEYCRQWVPDVYTYKGVLAMDEYGMAYGYYSAKKGFFDGISSNAVKACEQAKPFGKCREVASISGGALALAWDKQRGQSFWSTADDLEAAKSAALAKCGSAAYCTIATWVFSPSRTTSDDAPISGHGWLPGSDNALATAMLKQKGAKLYSTQMVLDNFAFIFTSSDYLDKNDAERSIKDYCRATSQGACTVAQTFSDTCGAVAYAKYQGKPKYFFATDEDPKRAERKALDQCFAKYGDNDCYFYPAQCTGLKYGRTPALYTQVKQEAVNEQTQAAQRALQKWQSTGEAVPRQ